MNIKSFKASSTTSTMDLAKELASAHPSHSFFAVVAKKQTKGRGRQGAIWIQAEDQSISIESSDLEESWFEECFEDEPDLLPFTLCLKSSYLAVPVSWVSSLIGCALIDTLKHCANQILFLNPSLSKEKIDDFKKALCLKWPNDILFFKSVEEFYKIGGVLIETTVRESKVENIYIGVGINFFSAPILPKTSSWKQELLNTCLKSKIFEKNLIRNRNFLLREFAKRFIVEIKNFLFYPKTIEQLKHLTLERSLPLGTVFSFEKKQHTGIFKGLNDEGALLLEGKDEPFYSSSDFQIAEPRAFLQNQSLFIKKTGFLALDFGNTRLHLSFSCEETLINIHLNYDLFQDHKNETRETSLAFLKIALLEKSLKTIFLGVSSVTEKDRTRDVLKIIKSFLLKNSGDLIIKERILNNVSILSSLKIKNPYQAKILGSDRALKIYDAFWKAKSYQTNVLVFTIGTGMTCEGVSKDGVLIESLITPGILMSFDALHEKTALIPPISDFKVPSSSFLKSCENHSTKTSIIRGVLLEKIALIVAVAKLHSPCRLYLSGIDDKLKGFMTESLGDIPFEFISFLETNVILSILKDISEKNMRDKINISRSNGALKSISPFKIKKREKKEVNITAHAKKTSHDVLKAKKFFEKNVPQENKENYFLDKELKSLGPKIEKEFQDKRIDSYLGTQYPFLTRRQWKQKIQLNEVFVLRSDSEEKRTIKPTSLLKEGDRILFYTTTVKDKNASHTKILKIYDNGDICAFLKPPHLVIHAVGMHVHNTLLNALSQQEDKDIYPVHRIDKETSGLIMCARNVKTRQFLTEIFAAQKVKKMYLAVVKGVCTKPFKITSPIGQPEGSKIRLKLWVGGKDAKSAETNILPLAEKNGYSLLACFPKTGRTNQIRIHLASRGFWIIGDKMYHPNENVFIDFYENGLTTFVKQQALVNRHMLHNTIFSSCGEGLPWEEIIVSPLYEDMKTDLICQDLFKAAGIPTTDDLFIPAMKEIFSSYDNIIFPDDSEN